jgi:hypothetical protein
MSQEGKLDRMVVETAVKDAEQCYNIAKGELQAS